MLTFIHKFLALSFKKETFLINPHNSYADRIAAKVMLAGLNANLGIDAEFLGEYQKVYLEAENLDNEQEA